MYAPVCACMHPYAPGMLLYASLGSRTRPYAPVLGALLVVAVVSAVGAPVAVVALVVVVDVASVVAVL